MEKYEAIHRSRKEIMWNNFLGGISWGLGATIGVSVILAMLGFIVSKLDLVPVIGTFVSNIMDFVTKNNQHIR
jgi:hypothetical protein